MKSIAALFTFAALLPAQGPSKNPIVDTSKGIYAIAKGDILKAADKIPDSMWSFQPTPQVRTVAQLFAHVADAQYEFCGPASGDTSPGKDIEKNAKSKDEIVSALKTAFAYCDAAYGQMNDTKGAELVDFFGRKAARIGIMEFNIAHTMEHYGNLVTYMRLKNIVPPSSESQK